MYLVLDTRDFKLFKNTTFSGHSKPQVRRAFQQAVALAQYDYAIHWAFELLCSGLVDTLWKLLFETYAQQIQRSNPLLAVYLQKRFEEFQPLRDAHAQDIPQIRNSNSARFIVAEAVALIVMSRKSKLPNMPSIKPEVDYAWERIQEMAVAPLRTYASAVLKTNDPPEIMMPANELAYSIREALETLLTLSTGSAGCSSGTRPPRRAEHLSSALNDQTITSIQNTSATLLGSSGTGLGLGLELGLGLGLGLGVPTRICNF